MLKSLIALITLNLTSIGIHIYLALKHYPLKYGKQAGDLACDINSTFNCSAVSASPFSEILGIPIALFGAMTHIVLLVFALGLALNLFSQERSIKRIQALMALFVAIMSVLMGLISSLAIGKYCLFCMILYVLSFVILYFSLKVSPKPLFPSVTDDLIKVFSGKLNTVLILILSIPALAYLFNNSLSSQQNPYGERESMYIQEATERWIKASAVNLDATQPLLTKGPEDADLVISEFADFLCSHCREASDPLNSFFQSHKDRVRVQFYVFPLDGECNEKLPKRSGNSCVLSKAVYCNKDNTSGWKMHDYIFSKQKDFFSISHKDLKEQLADFYFQNTQKDKSEFLACLESEDAHSAIMAQAKLGANIDIQGTPTIFANQKKVNHFGLIRNVLDNLLKTMD